MLTAAGKHLVATLKETQPGLLAEARTLLPGERPEQLDLPDVPGKSARHAELRQADGFTTDYILALWLVMFIAHAVFHCFLRNLQPGPARRHPCENALPHRKLRRLPKNQGFPSLREPDPPTISESLLGMHLPTQPFFHEMTAPGFRPLPAYPMTRSILIALSTTHHGFLRGVAKYAREHGWHIDATMAYTGMVPRHWSGDGVISHCGFSDELADHVNSLGLPTVEITAVNQRVNAARIDTDYAGFGAAAAEYFLTRQFKHFAVAPLAGDSFHMERLQGFIERLALAGHSVAHLPPLIADISAQSIDWASRVRLINARLNELPKPIAVFAYNDAVGVDLIKACLDIGLLVPEQVAVMGVDNDELLCEVSPVSLSSVRFDLAELAYQGAAFLDEILDGRSLERHRLVPAGSGIEVRLSSDISAMDNVHVAKACVFITRHLTDPNLSVAAVAAHAGLSERGMFKAFIKHVGRTMQEEISVLRHEKVCELLRTSTISIKQIAAATGFSSGNYLTRAFRHRHQMTPEEYRRLEAGRSPRAK